PLTSTLSLHDALPLSADTASAHIACVASGSAVPSAMVACASAQTRLRGHDASQRAAPATDNAAASPNSGQVKPNTSGLDTCWLADRKSTRLNSSHVKI